MKFDWFIDSLIDWSIDRSIDVYNFHLNKVRGSCYAKFVHLAYVSDYVDDIVFSVHLSYVFSIWKLWVESDVVAKRDRTYQTFLALSVWTLCGL